MHEVSLMAARISIDAKLIEEALELSGERSKSAAATRALEEFIARRRGSDSSSSSLTTDSLPRQFKHGDRLLTGH